MLPHMALALLAVWRRRWTLWHMLRAFRWQIPLSQASNFIISMCFLQYAQYNPEAPTYWVACGRPNCSLADMDEAACAPGPAARRCLKF